MVTVTALPALAEPFAQVLVVSFVQALQASFPRLAVSPSWVSWELHLQGYPAVCIEFKRFPNKSSEVGAEVSKTDLRSLADFVFRLWCLVLGRLSRFNNLMLYLLVPHSIVPELELWPSCSRLCILSRCCRISYCFQPENRQLESRCFRRYGNRTSGSNSRRLSFSCPASRNSAR